MGHGLYLRRALLAALALTLTACDDSGDDGGSADDPDTGGPSIIIDMGMPTPWEGDGEPPESGVEPMDMGVEVDAAPEPSCFAEGADLEQTFASDPIAGAKEVRADLDMNGDDAPDLTVKVIDEQGVRFAFLDGLTAEEISTLSFPGAANATLMPGIHPRPPLLQPLMVGGAPVLALLEQRADMGPLGVRVVRADNLEGLRFIELPRGLDALHITPGGGGWLLLVNEAIAQGGGCTVYSLGQDAPVSEMGLCRLMPGWDVNNDGVAEVVRWGGTGTQLLDGATLEPVATTDQRYLLGFQPTDAAGGGGPLDLRGRGPELAAAIIEDGTLRVYYLDPIELTPNGEPQPAPGNFERFEFMMSADGLRLIGQEERGGLRYLHVYEPATVLRERAQYGPFRFLQWTVQADINLDGAPELRILGGSTEDGTNTDLLYIDPTTGMETFTVGAERAGRFDGVFLQDGPHGRVTDLDGCPGADIVVLRSGNPTRAGQRPTRLLVFDPDGNERFRGAGHDGFARSLALADLASDGTVELIELRGDTPENATLYVHSQR